MKVTVCDRNVVIMSFKLIQIERVAFSIPLVIFFMIIFARAREASVANKPILGCPQVIWVRHKKKEAKRRE